MYSNINNANILMSGLTCILNFVRSAWSITGSWPNISNTSIISVRISLFFVFGYFNPDFIFNCFNLAICCLRIPIFALFTGIYLAK